MIKQIMIRAHQLAKGFEGHYSARLSLALRQAWSETKAPMLSGLKLCRSVIMTEEATVITEAHSGWSKGWVARVTLAPVGAKFDLDRRFVNADDRDVNRAGNGYLTYSTRFMADGIYEADTVRRSMESQRVYFRIATGIVIEVFESKVAAKVALSDVSKAA
ncbi:MAG: hypothetical protein K6T85_19305 [Gorillibacterium sp.]|nr:hypothetical protein [Gorillibacterium sp.]